MATWPQDRKLVAMAIRRRMRSLVTATCPRVGSLAVRAKLLRHSRAHMWARPDILWPIGRNCHTVFSGSVTMSDATGEIIIFTRTQSNFANDALPTGEVTVTGIVSDFNSPQFVLRSRSDVQGGSTGGTGVNENFRHMTAIDSAIIDGEYMLENGPVACGVFGAGVSYHLGVVPNLYAEPVEIFVPSRTSSFSRSRPRRAAARARS